MVLPGAYDRPLPVARARPVAATDDAPAAAYRDWAAHLSRVFAAHGVFPPPAGDRAGAEPTRVLLAEPSTASWCTGATPANGGPLGAGTADEMGDDDSSVYTEDFEHADANETSTGFFDAATRGDACSSHRAFFRGC